MKITKNQLKRIIKEEKAKLNEQPLDATLARTENQYGRTEGGSPQSYADLATRLDAIVLMIEGLTMDYVDSQWLVDGDHASLSVDLESLFAGADSLNNAVDGLAQSMGEI